MSSKKQHNSYMRKYYHKKKNLLLKYKESLKCQNCDENHPACLDFHHRDPSEKGFGIGDGVVCKGTKQLMDEIAKCDVLCSNCHRKLHYDLGRNT